MYNVLIADDSSVERNGIHKLLEKYDEEFQIMEACNGEAALELIQNCETDIVFTDIRMPILNGIELLCKIKEVNSDIKVIIFSAYDDFEYTGKAIENGADRYMLKPINIDEFNRVLASVIDEIKKAELNSKQENRIIENVILFDNSYRVYSENNIIDKIFAEIEQKKFDNLDTRMVEMFAELKRQNILSILYLKQVVAEIVKKLYEYVDETNKRDIYKIINKIILIKSIDEMESKIPDMVREICDAIVSIPEKGEINNDVKKALKIIHSRYNEDISLYSIAEEVHLSPKYFGKMFKNSVGIGISKYLTNYRLEQAKWLLESTNETILSLCEKIGIKDASYFCFIFKKKYGITPEQYRNEANKK